VWCGMIAIPLLVFAFESLLFECTAPMIAGLGHVCFFSARMMDLSQGSVGRYKQVVDLQA